MAKEIEMMPSDECIRELYDIKKKIWVKVANYKEFYKQHKKSKRVLFG